MSLSPTDVTALAQLACLLEVSAPKPGNVSPGRPFRDTCYEEYVASAVAVGPALGAAGEVPLGMTIWRALDATRRWTGANTNLGIVLLLAPLARAAMAQGGLFRDRLGRVLLGLDVRDAQDTYRAIRLAEPGGLGRVGGQDLRAAPGVSLLECMRLAAGRDAIAREYATGFETTLLLGLPTLRRLRDRHVPLPQAIAQTYLTLLSAAPDTHLARRHGQKPARRVARLAGRALDAGGFLTERGRALAERLDGRLRAARPPLNPGATADLTAASLFLWLLEDQGWAGPIGAGAALKVRSTRAKRRGSSRARQTRSRPGSPAAPRPGGAALPPRSRRRRTRPVPRTTARRRGRRPPSAAR